MLDGHVPYIWQRAIMISATTNFNNRNTKYNTYFKITDNPLNNPATGGIIKGTFEPNHLGEFLLRHLCSGRPENAHFHS